MILKTRHRKYLIVSETTIPYSIRDVTPHDLALGHNQDWADLLMVLKIQADRNPTSMASSEREFDETVRALVAKHKMQVNGAMAKVRRNESLRRAVNNVGTRMATLQDRNDVTGPLSGPLKEGRAYGLP